jgi:hypothetical protein
MPTSLPVGQNFNGIQGMMGGINGTGMTMSEVAVGMTAPSQLVGAQQY